MEFRVLGPVQLWADGGPVPLKERKLRLVLALLLLDANQLVPIDRLVDVLWPHDPPHSARRIVQAHLSRLRTTLESLDRGQAQLARYGECYMLSCDPEIVDVHLFRALLSRARHTDDDYAKVDILRRALSLWRGPALADVATDGLRRELCTGLDEARLTAIEERIDVELRRGAHTVVLDELVDLHARHPSRSRVAAHFMVALHRSGRSSEALQVYLRTRQWLRAELGVDPTADLDRLYTAILRADPALDVPRSRPDGGTSITAPMPPTSPMSMSMSPSMSAMTPMSPMTPMSTSMSPSPLNAGPDGSVPSRETAPASGRPGGSPRVETDARAQRAARTAAESVTEADFRVELESMAAQRGVGVRALIQQILADWIDGQQKRPAAAPNHLDVLARNLEEASSAVAALVRQAEHGTDGGAAAA